MGAFPSPDSDVLSSFLEVMCQCSDCHLVLGSVDHLQRLPCVCWIGLFAISIMPV